MKNKLISKLNLYNEKIKLFLSKNWIFVVGIVFLVTLFLRLYRMDLTRVEGNDIVREFYYAQRILSGDFYFGGVPISITKHMQATFGALEYYLVAIPMFFSKSPIVAGWFVALLNSIAVFMCYKLCKHFFNRETAIIAALLYAVNPWAIFYSRFVWNPNFVSFFAVLFLYTIFKVAIEDKKWYILGSFACLAALLQFHLITLFLSPLLIFVFKKKNLKPIIFGIILFCIIFLPYLIHNLAAGTSPLEPLMYTSARSQGNTFLINLRDSLGMPIMIATNYYGSFMLGNLGVSANSFLNLFFNFITVIISLLFLISFFYIIRKYWFERDKRDLILLSWYIIPVLGFVLINKNISPHYGLMLYPVQFIIIARFVTEIKKLKLLMLFLIIIIAISNFIYILEFNKTVDYNGGTTAAFGIPYKFKLETAQYIVNDTTARPLNIIFFKGIKKEFNYIFYDILKENPKYSTINSIGELKNLSDGYFIFDSMGLYGYSERKLTLQEVDIVEKAYFKKRFGGMTVIKLPYNNLNTTF